jgi:hypothetical protein
MCCPSPRGGGIVFLQIGIAQGGSTAPARERNEFVFEY